MEVGRLLANDFVLVSLFCFSNKACDQAGRRTARPLTGWPNQNAGRGGRASRDPQGQCVNTTAAMSASAPTMQLAVS